jgi:PAS domain S-box-containing protein
MFASKPITSVLFRYLFALLTFVAALLLSQVFNQLVDESPFLFYYGAVIISAWKGGAGPGLIVALLAILTTSVPMLDEPFSFRLTYADLVQFGVFSLIVILVSWLEQTRRATEQTLREDSESFQIILNNVADGIYAMDPSARIIYANAAAAEIAGFPSPEAMLSAPREALRERYVLYDEQRQPLSDQQMPSYRTLTEGVNHQLTYLLEDKARGEERWIIMKSSPVFDKNGKVRMVINVFRDITDRKVHELRLSRQNERLRVTLASLIEGVITTDAAGNIERINPAAEKLTGWKESDALGIGFDDIFSMVDEATDERVTHPIRSIVQGEQTFAEYTGCLLTSKDGARSPIDMSASAIVDATQQITGVVVVFRDISTRYQVERIREQNERRLRDVLDNLPIAVGVLNIEGRIVGANRTMLTTMAAEIKDLVGVPLDETVWWSSEPEAQRQFRDAVSRGAAGEVVRYDTRLRRPDEQPLMVEFTLSPLRDVNGDIYALLPSVVDVTDRQRAVNERTQLAVLLETQRRRLENLIANVPGILWEGHGAPGEDQQVDFVNDYAEQMLGYSVEEWTSEPGFWTKIVHPEDLDSAEEEATRVFDEAHQGSVQFRLIAKDGRVIPVEARTLVLTDENGYPANVTGLAMDISQRVESERALAQYAQELKRSNEELQQFAYVASHDLQEPLRMVASYLQLLQRRYQDHLDEDANEFIEYAVDGATRMKALINDLLTYSRVQTKQQPFKAVVLEEVVNTALTNLQVAIEDNAAEIIYDELPTVSGDSRQLVQVFQNLIGNALKFRSDAPPCVRVSAKRRSGEWIISVSDNGIGIEEAYRERIFIIFQRLHGKGKYSGTGIGLAICKKVVERHGGRIWVESEPGNGTTFYFTLPAIKDNKRRE